MSWYQLAKKNELLFGYYDPVPDLNSIELRYLIVSDDIIISLYMPYMPNKKMPAKWHTNNYDKMLLELGCYDVKKAEINNWNFDKKKKKFNININNINEIIIEGKSQIIEENESNFYIQCKTLYVRKLEPIISNAQGYF